MSDHTEVRPRGHGVTKVDRTLPFRKPHPPHQRVNNLVLLDRPQPVEPSQPSEKKSLVVRPWD